MDERWLQVLGKMTYGIYVLTTCFEKTINGMIASWVSQISYEPLLVTAAVHPNRYSNELIRKSGHFGLNILTKDQKALLKRFKGSDPLAKFGSIQWFKGKTGCPVLKESLGYLECRVIASYEPGNHTLFIGEVVEAQILSLDDPLSTLDYEGFYMGKA